MPFTIFPLYAVQLTHFQAVFIRIHIFKILLKLIFSYSGMMQIGTLNKEIFSQMIGVYSLTNAIYPYCEHNFVLILVSLDTASSRQARFKTLILYKLDFAPVVDSPLSIIPQIYHAERKRYDQNRARESDYLYIQSECTIPDARLSG